MSDTTNEPAKVDYIALERCLGFLLIWSAMGGSRQAMLDAGVTNKTYHSRLNECRDVLGIDLKDPAAAMRFMFQQLGDDEGFAALLTGGAS